MKNKLELFEMNSLLYFIMRSGFIGIAANAIVNVGKVDGYMCPILGTIIGLIILFLYIKIIDINPDKNINENITDIFGKNLGNVIIIILTLFITSLAIILYYDINNFLNSEYLYFTPTAAIAISLVLPIIYLLIHNIKIIGRVSIILFFLSVALYILSIAGLLNQVKFDNLLPILENGFNPVFKGTLIYVAYTVLPIFLLTIIPKNTFESPGKLKKKIIKYYFIDSLIIIISETVLISVLGIELAALYQYPDYHLLRRITLGGFIQRIESLLAMQWILCIFIMIVLACHYITSSLNYVFKFKNEKILKYIIPIVIMYFSINIFKNNTISTMVEIKYYPYFIFVFLLGIPIIIYIVHYIKKKRIA